MSESESMSSYQQRPVVDFNTVKMRLDSTELIQRLEEYLRGQTVSYSVDSKTEELVRQVHNNGEPKANAKGIQSILSWVQCIVNPQVVQGNFPVNTRTGESIMYEDWMRDFHESIAEHIVFNASKWDMDDDDLNGVINMIVKMVGAFMTRLIGNEERKSYGETFRHVESTNLKGKGNNLFKS